MYRSLQTTKWSPQRLTLWFSTPNIFKNSIQLSQALGIKRICSETSEIIRHLKDLKNTFINWRYKPELLNYHSKRVMHVNRKGLFEKNQLSRKVSSGYFNKTLPKIKNVIHKLWHILSINEKLNFTKSFW